MTDPGVVYLMVTIVFFGIVITFVIDDLDSE